MFSLLFSLLVLLGAEKNTEAEYVKHLAELNARCEKQEDGSWEVEFESELGVSDDCIVKAMGSAENPGPLRKLEAVSKLAIFDGEIGERAFSLLSELPSVRELILSGTAVDVTSAQAIAKFKGIKYLMAGSGVNDDALKQLLALSELEGLDLQTASISDSGLKLLVSLKKLRFLDISHQQVSAAGLENLRELEALERLVLRGVDLKDRDLKALSGIKKLEVLVLDFNSEISGSGFAEICGLDSLTTLSLYQAKLSGQNIRHFSRFSKLQRLLVHGKNQRFGILDLAALSSLAELDEVIVGESKRNENSEAEFAQKLPQVKLSFLGE